MASRESHIIKCGMRRRASDERGAFMVIFALMLLVLLGFTALGIEAGRWYLVRAELAKGVDAAALVGARNISNPYVTPYPGRGVRQGEFPVRLHRNTRLGHG